MKGQLHARDFPYYLHEIREAVELLHHKDAEFTRVLERVTDKGIAKQRYARWLIAMRAHNREVIGRAQKLDREIADELTDVWFSTGDA